MHRVQNFISLLVAAAVLTACQGHGRVQIEELPPMAPSPAQAAQEPTSPEPPREVPQPAARTIVIRPADPARDKEFQPDDGNYMLILDDGILKLAPEDDTFGSAFDTTKWTKTEGSCAVSETGGEIIVDRIGSAAGGGVIDRNASSVRFADADIAAEASYLDPAIKSYGAFFRLTLTLNASNEVLVAYKVRGANYPLVVYKRINGVISELCVGPDIGSQSKLRLALRRDSSNNQFTAYYSTWNVGLSQWNAWTQYWQGIINDPTYFNTSHTLYPRIQSCWAATTDNFDFKFNEYWQRTDVIPAQRFWKGSFKCNIMDASGEGGEYCLDAGKDRAWRLKGFSAEVSAPGESSVMFKAGYSDSPERASAIWLIPRKWITASKLNKRVAAGALDGHRYVFLKARFISNGKDQPALTLVSFRGTECNTFKASLFDVFGAIDDRNEKVILENGTAKLAPDGDEFGTVLDTTYWTELDGSTIQPGHETKQKASLSETGGVLTNTDGGTTAWALSGRREGGYLSCDLVLEWSDTQAADKPYGAGVCFYLWKDAANYVRIAYDCRAVAGNKRLSAISCVNGVWTTHWINPIGLHKKLRMRIKRDSSTNTFTYYYATWNTGSGVWNAWTEIWSGVLVDPATFKTTDELRPTRHLRFNANNSDTFTPKLDRFYQNTTGGMPAQRFWNDSLEILVINNLSVDWAFDAGEGQVWKLSGAGCEKSEPGSARVKFKLGRSDTGKKSDVKWVDTRWLTIEQAKANAAASSYDSHRYIHVKAQFNSDGTDQPTLTSFSITGVRVAP